MQETYKPEVPSEPLPEGMVHASEVPETPVPDRTDGEATDFVNWVRPRPPKEWKLMQRPRGLPEDPNMVFMGMYGQRQMGGHIMTVSVSLDILHAYQPGDGIWLHLSIARDDRIPTWNEIARVRHAFGYGELVFIQLLPPAVAWINVHPNCLHVFSRLDSPTVPVTLWNQWGADASRYRHGVNNASRAERSGV